MTEVELIVAALVAGSAAGITDTASSAVRDSYHGLKSLLARRLAGRDEARRALDAEETEPAVWHARLADDLAESGADTDEEVLAAARALLSLVDPARSQAGEYHVSVSNNYGAAGTFTAPVTINNNPPAWPGAA
jgi:hypothetical protein